MSLDSTVRDFLAEVAAPNHSSTAGAVGAVTTAAAAGLVAMSARLSPSLDNADELADRADRLREQAMSLSVEDGEVYAEVLAAQRRTDSGRTEALHSALAAASEPPLRLAHTAAETATLAAKVATSCKRAVRGDAVTAATLAAASARGAAALARENLTAAGRSLDPALEADQAAAAGQSAADAALAAAANPA